MHVLFIHRDGPGQFVHLAQHLVALGHSVTLLCERAHGGVMPGVRVIKHRAVNPNDSEGRAPGYHLRMGEEVARILDALKRSEGTPDVIMGHGGWGSLLFAKDVFPDIPLVAYCEFFYHAKGADLGFDPTSRSRFADIARVKGRNFAQLSTLTAMDAGVSPTQWQKSLFPRFAQSKIGVVHEGIDTAFCRPDAAATLALPSGRTVHAGERIVTYAARDLEPYRGFPQFMAAAAALARLDPQVTFLVAGGDSTSYGPGPACGGTWREAMLAETGLDPGRIHFLGTVPHADLIKLFQVSAAHVYLSYPFVLSWSMLEAMASGVLLIGSATPPVQEFAMHQRNALLVPFFEEAALVAAMRQALDSGDRLRGLRQAARETVTQRASLRRSLSQQIIALETMANGGLRRSA